MNLQERLKETHIARLQTADVYDDLQQYEYITDLPIGLVIRILAILGIQYYTNGIMLELAQLFNNYETTN